MLALAVTAELSRLDPSREVTFTIANDVTATGDPDLLRLALENLLGNAWKYSSKHSSARIEFGADRRNGSTVYFVRDDGAGFDLAHRDRLFGAVQRLHRENE